MKCIKSIENKEMIYFKKIYHLKVFLISDNLLYIIIKTYLTMIAGI